MKVRKILLPIIVSAVVALCSSCDGVKSNLKRLNQGFENLTEFRTASKSLTLEASEEVVYEEVTSYSNDGANVSYTQTIKELSEDLTSTDKYVTNTTQGSFSTSKLGEYFPSSYSFNNEDIKDLNAENNEYTFKIVKAKVDDVFDIDPDSLSGEGIDVKVIITDKMVTKYTCTYKTASGLDVTMTSTFSK